MNNTNKVSLSRSFHYLKMHFLKPLLEWCHKKGLIKCLTLHDTSNNLERKISEIDTQLATTYPLNKRVFEVCKRINPDSVTIIHENTFQVLNWYIENYQIQENIIGSLGYKPFLLNGRLYHILIKLSDYGDKKQIIKENSHSYEKIHKLTFLRTFLSNKQITERELKDCIIDMRQSEKDNLNEENLNLILNEKYKAGRFYHRIYALEAYIENKKIDTEISHLLVTGIYDINITLSAFSNPFFLDAQPVIFHVQQAVEKFLKSLYAHLKSAEICNSDKNVADVVEKDRQYRHRIDELGQALNTLIPDFNFNTINTGVQKLYNEVPNMDIRYKKDSDKTIEKAIDCINLMIEICDYVAKYFLDLPNV